MREWFGDLEMIAVGGFSLLTGFMNEVDYKIYLNFCFMVLCFSVILDWHHG
ncbi:hypothetical protein [Anabaena sp. FACHB-1391]|uniref:hypothetical protein n=1 Tax=Anabaena sp. FACHB-1391 TaxID=2692771 RepID=UPI001F548E36|nr:hypothetical protein [Anabaena sp. FACHB-1391]